MKEGLDRAAIQRMANNLAQVFDELNVDTFVDEACSQIEALELKQRVDFLIERLQTHLEGTFPEIATRLVHLPPVWDRGDENDALRGFAAWPVIDYVAVAGLDHPDIALDVLEKLTSLFSAEFAVRPFIQKHPELTNAKLQDWSEHEDLHVRRLASEGCRPRLPWGIRLNEFINDPAPVLAVLERLNNDPDLYVRRSVANNLNDISKDHPDLVIQTCQRWLELNQGAETAWIVKQALRTLVKQGHPDVFALLGYSANHQVQAQLSLNQKELSIGESLPFTVLLETEQDEQSVVVDYVVHHQKANGKTAPKVFKLKSVTLNSGNPQRIEKSHSFKPVTTRKYYPGEHILAVQINGVEVGREVFWLRG
ncbi:MAG: DNA alkylation repair protein [Pseudomonadales bacterium]|nr:DNA alkylation repair protein [Pseudomonadales bacterium]